MSEADDKAANEGCPMIVIGERHRARRLIYATYICWDKKAAAESFKINGTPLAVIADDGSEDYEKLFTAIEELGEEEALRQYIDSHPLDLIDTPIKAEKANPDGQMLVCWKDGAVECFQKCADRREMQGVVTTLALNPNIENETIEVFKQQSVLIAIDVRVVVD